MIRLVRFVAIAVFTSVFVVLGSVSNGLAQAVPTRVEVVYSTTAGETDVPLRVPSLIPLNSQAAPSEYWAFSISPTTDSYSISFDRAEDCSSVEECSFAVASGRVRTANDQSLDSLVARANVNGAEAITLSDGTAAVYVPFREGLYMPSYIYWDVGEYRYIVGIYMADKSDVLEMANSATSAE